ncbi:hypothetical protein JMJ35_005437 [Cladonia borealis]|uniref:Uncharacterized protein n=1 Tax=Cladonia borealis TaxID=184061 RepID=A0AA39V5A0_9LECA|nr:hypothetical protein JMJ35_005437 [Cladonia borealis]
MEGQHGYVPPTESKTENSQQSGYQQTGFQPANDESSKGFQQTGFQPANDESSKGFQQTGFQPTDTSASPTFNSSGFQPVKTGYQPLPAQQKTTISAEKFSEIEQAVKAAKAALDKVDDLISDIAFTPQPSGGFD